jgi:hypothetical protein
MFTDSFRHHKIGNALGTLSILLAVVPIVYPFHADAFPDYALTEKMVLLYCVGSLPRGISDQA